MSCTKCVVTHDRFAMSLAYLLLFNFNLFVFQHYFTTIFYSVIYSHGVVFCYSNVSFLLWFRFVINCNMVFVLFSLTSLICAFFVLFASVELIILLLV